MNPGSFEIDRKRLGGGREENSGLVKLLDLGSYLSNYTKAHYNV